MGESIQLKGGHTATDPRLGRIPQFDPRSRAFPIAAVVPEGLRSRSWACPIWLDQGYEGACVSFAWHHEAGAWPAIVRGLTDSMAFTRYKEMQRVDEWPGESYSGTSVLAGAKVMHGYGYFDEYRWAFSVDEALRAISHEGPAVFGLPWMDTMFDTRADGLLDVSGQEAGGHAILGRGVLVPRKGVANVTWPDGRRVRIRTDEPLVRLRNSWGRGWGVQGEGLLRASDLEVLMRDWGEACIPVKRRVPKLTV